MAEAKALQLINGVPTYVEVDGTGKFEKIFAVNDWFLNLDGDYELLIPAAEHTLGNNVAIVVEELVGSDYEQVETVIRKNAGDIKILINNDLRFVGRVLIKD